MKTQRNNFQQKLPKNFRKFFQKNMLHIWLRGVIYDKSRIFPLYYTGIGGGNVRADRRGRADGRRRGYDKARNAAGAI